jgi:hypothetical protein
MAQPVWVTPAGSLGTVAEGVFFQVPLIAVEPTVGEPVLYQVIAGQLPAGVQCAPNGNITGIPQAVYTVQGVPADVSRDVTSKFAVRAYTEQVVGGIRVINRLADRTFTLTVTGQDAPEFVTPAGSLGTFYDCTVVEGIQVEISDTDPDDSVMIVVAAGSLPPGLAMTHRGLISGFTQSIVPNAEQSGFSRDGQGFDQFLFDFGANNVNRTYEFVLRVTDGKSSNLRSYTITILNRASLTADTTEFSADNTFVTADGSPVVAPILLTPQGSIGRVRSDNFYAFKFDAYDCTGAEIGYNINLGEGIGFSPATVNFAPGSFDREGFDQQAFILPPGLSLDPGTGWLWGYIPDSGLTEYTYDFAIQVYQADAPAIISDYYYYSITIVGAVDTGITWITPAHVGSIATGSISTLSIQALVATGAPLQYRLKPGSASALPQGLTLLPSGNITGRVSFNTFALDGNTTTFDMSAQTVLLTGTDTETTFDRTFRFTVEAFSSTSQIDVFREFTITIDRVYDQPYENLYIQAMPPESDRALVNSLLQNRDIIPDSLLYRGDDMYFGRATRVVYEHAFGLTSATITQYVDSLQRNHYWKNLVLGEIETAQARDDAGNVMYEVVYSRIVDNLVNDAGESVSREVVLPYSVTYGEETNGIVYPNSLINMRTQVIDTVGQISNVLPRWMLSKQANGRVLGFVPAWVIAYTIPGAANQIAYNIRTQFSSKLNQVDFEVDRYELDRLLSKNWDTETQSWEPTPAATTFDISPGPTTVFDGNSLRFIAPVDMPVNETTRNDFDKYLVFPKTTILG